MNVAVIGTGGREHALARKCAMQESVESVFVIPGNPGMTKDSKITVCLKWNGAFHSLYEILIEKDISLVIIGNESYLEEGLVDYLTKREIKVFGPNQKAAKLESSKNFAKEFMQKHGIPTAGFETISSLREAREYIKKVEGPLVIKQDGLALGKGVLVTQSKEEADQFLSESFMDESKVVFEEFLSGKEFSLLAFVNNEYYNLMIPARDYKRAHDGNKGLNTGGMGAYAPVEYVSDEDLKIVEKSIVEPTIDGLIEDGLSFVGILYFGLMKTNAGIKVIEYNVRFGDPEAEVLLEAMDSNLLEVIEATMEKKPFQIKWKPGVTLGVCLASKGYPSQYQKGFPIHIPNEVNYYSMALSIDQDSLINNGGRVLFVVGRAQTLQQAQLRAYEQVVKVRSSNLYYRTDIGM